MRDETRNDAGGQEQPSLPVAPGRGSLRPRPGATVSIPPRTAPPGLAAQETLRTRLTLLRPQPMRLRPAPRDDSE